MEKKRVVFPGDEVGTTEEFMAGEGTYESDGKIYAANIGTLEFDEKTRFARINPITSTPVTLSVGDNVIGKVMDIRSSMVFVDVARVLGEEREISGETSGSIHVSKVTRAYIEDIRRVYWIGDLIKAKVIQVDPSLQLSTEGNEFGVIKSFCKICQEPLEVKDKDLYCKNCERLWQKKFTDDYREGNV